MAATGVPTQFMQGVSAEFTVSSADYHSDIWDLTVSIVGAVAIPAVATAHDDGSWLVSIAKNASADATPGTYGYALVVGDGTTEAFIGHGTLRLLANPALADEPYDPRSPAQKILDNVRAAIALLTEGKPVAEYTIEGRSATYYSLGELIQLESRYAFIVNQEEAAARGQRTKQSRIRFR